MSADLIFIGPNDLALGLLGYTPARGDEPVFSEAMVTIVAAARKHGKWVSRLSNSGDAAKEHLQTYDTVALPTEMKAITAWYQAQLEAIRTGCI